MEIKFNPQTPSIQTPVPGSQEAKIRETSDEFAAVLFAQMFSEMRPKAGEEESLFGGEQDTELFMDMFDLAIGQKFIANGNPVADQLYQQLIGNQKSPGS